jgi:uncharacterized Rmd1/YagE family protein
MSDLLLTGKTTFHARAILVGNRLDLRAMEEGEALALTPLTIEVEGGVAVLYRYGVIVLFGVDPLRETLLLTHMKPLIGSPYTDHEVEDVLIRIDPNAREGMRANTVIINRVDVEHLQIIADVIAKSAILARYEARLTQNIDRIEPLAVELERHGRIGGSAKEFLRHIGSMLLSEHTMVGRVTITEKPEVLWEKPFLQGLYNRLEDEFEILERHSALERKLNLISRTAETLLDLLNTRHALRLEWYIILLIVGEILLTLYQMFMQ